MPKIFHKRSGSWTEVKSVFHKRNGAWTEVLNVFRKTSGSWVKVFAAAKIPGNTVPPTITGNGYLFGTLTNTNLGTWTNTPTSYARQWRRGTPPSGGGLPTSYSNISGETSSTYVTTSLDNGKYIVCQVTATNAIGNNIAVSNEIYISKYEPVSLLPYTLSGTSTVGSTLTALEQIGSWKNTTTNTGDTYPDTFEYEWSYTDGTIIQSSTLSVGSYPRNVNSDSLLITSADLNKQIRVRVTGTNTGGSATSGYTTSGTVTTVYSFAFGNTLYVGSNGYIGLDNGGTIAGTAGNGRNINIWNEDLVQYKLQEYSDSSNYHLYFRAYRYQSPLVRSAINALDYQIKFYTGQPYCDVYLVRKGSSVPFYIDNPGYYSNGLNGGTGIVGPFAWAAGSVLRVYFNGTLASTSAASWTAIPDTVWKDITSSDIDDSYTSVVTSANQQAPTLTAPVLNSVTPGPQGGLVQANFTGGSGPVYQMFWWGTATAPTTAVTPDGERTFSPLEDATGPSSTATQYMYVRSVSTAGETSVGPSSIASAWSNGIAFNMTSTAVSQSTAPTARATNTFSTSTVKYLDSITWSAGTYNNAASVTSVLLYSTNTSNLVSPSGNTLSSFRTTNPYTLTTTDPAGTPYVFSVRDTVVGTNGTTYYFFGNQITSANADAVAFSYGTATSASGGWTASVNAGTQSGATYSYVSATAGSGTVNSSTGAITASGLTSAQSSTITVNKAVSGYNTASTTATGTASTVVTYTLTYSANGGSSTPSSQTGASGDTITLAANAGTRSGFSFGGWNIGGTTYSGSSSYTFSAANATATAIWTAVFVTPTWNGTLPGWTSGSNFQRITTAPANYKWGWTNGTFSFSGSTGTSRGWNWEVRQTASTSGTHQSGSPSYWTYTTSNDTYTSVQGTFRPYLISSARGDVTYSTASRFGRVQPYIFGTDGNEYQGPFTGFI
jgi:hypothetical protein